MDSLPLSWDLATGCAFKNITTSSIYSSTDTKHYLLNVPFIGAPPLQSTCQSNFSKHYQVNMNQLSSKRSINRRRKGTNRPKSKRTKGGSVRTDVIGHKTPNTVALNYMPIFNTAVKKRLTYFDTASVTTTAGVLSSYVFSVNGMYDPNITGTGHQPAGFDQMMTFFDHYVVTHAKATVTWANATAGQTCQVALSLNSTVTPTSDYTILNETGYVTRDFLNVAGQPDAIKTASLTCDVSRFQGVPQIKDNPELWGSALSNPTEQSYFNISAWDALGGGTSVMRFEILIEFQAWFIEPRKISSSLASSLHKLLLSEEKSNASKSKH